MVLFSVHVSFGYVWYVIRDAEQCSSYVLQFSLGVEPSVIACIQFKVCKLFILDARRLLWASMHSLKIAEHIPSPVTLGIKLSKLLRMSNHSANILINISQYSSPNQQSRKGEIIVLYICECLILLLDFRQLTDENLWINKTRIE